MRNYFLFLLIIIAIVVFSASLYFFNMFKLGDSQIERVFMALFMTSWIIFMKRWR